MGLGSPWVYLAAAALSFAATLVTSPAGMSGAVLVLPLQTGVLGAPSGAVMPTNLLYNAIATPGALYRFWRQGQTGGWLTPLVVVATLPGVVFGSVLRVEEGGSARAFDFLIAAVLVPLGMWLLSQAMVRARSSRPAPVGQARPGWDEGGRERPPAPKLIGALAAGVGVVGGIYGIGSGSVLAPILVGLGYSPRLVSPASLASTMVTSIAGAITLLVMTTFHGGIVAPAWGLGVVLGVGGIIGGYVGARIQPWIPDNAIRAVLGLLVAAVGVHYLWIGA
jgi:uncharacterized membrane protein YfcA